MIVKFHFIVAELANGFRRCSRCIHDSETFEPMGDSGDSRLAPTAHKNTAVLAVNPRLGESSGAILNLSCDAALEREDEFTA